VRLAVLVRLGEHVGPDALQGLRADEVEAPVAREWRLSWRRQGLSRRYLLRQSEEACQRYLLRLQGRMEELHPEVDPEHYVCCEDERCTCGARATYAAEWARRGATVPPLVYWRIDSREVGAWEPEAITSIHLPEPCKHEGNWDRNENGTFICEECEQPVDAVTANVGGDDIPW
jgi:hypothetical protein